MTEQVTFAADITDEQARQIAAQIEQNAKGEMPAIRAALILLARSSAKAQLTDAGDAEAFMELLECVTDAIIRRRDEITLLESAEARLFLLLREFVE